MPTAQALLGEVAATPEKKSADPLGPGLGTRFQAIPFQCRVSVPPSGRLPTAQALLAEVAAMPYRVLLPTFGLGTCFQAAPFQCTIRTLPSPEPRSEPTAQALLAELAATPYRSSAAVPGSGLGTRFQAVP